MRIRILHLVLTMDTGGLENGVVNIINGLDETRYKSILCCIKHGGDLVERINKDIKIIELNHYSGMQYSIVRRLKKIIIDEGVDVIHTRNYKPYMFGFVAGKILGSVALIHSEHGKDYPFRKIKMFIQRVFSYYTDGIIALSSDIKSNMVNHIGIESSKIKVVINGVDTNKFSPTERSSELIREFNIEEGDLVIGAVGRLVSVKNYPEMLLAVKNLKATSANVKLIIVGDGPELESLQNLVHQYELSKEVCFTGSRSDISEILRLFDIYVLTSTNEGLSNTLLEAMSSSIPVIVSRVGGNTEIVSSDSVGLTYSSGDYDELTGKLRALSQDFGVRRQIAKNAREHIIKNYSLDAMIRNYADMYTDVYSKHHK